MSDDEQFGRWIGRGEHQKAAAWLVERYADEVYGLCLAMVRERTAAEDLAQEAFSRAFVGLAAFRGEASVRTWLLKIARNRAIDFLRTRDRRPWDDPVSDAGELDSQVDEAPLPSDLLLRRDDVEDALAELGAIERALVVLRFRNGLDYAELALAFGLGEGAVRMRLSRALGKMRRALEVKHAPAAAPAPPLAQATFAPPPAAPAEADDDETTGELLLAEVDTFGQAAPLADDEPKGAQAERAAPPPGAPRVAAQDVRARRGGGLVSRLTELFRREAPPPPSPPVGHPLTAYFAATREPLPWTARERLLRAAGDAAG